MTKQEVAQAVAARTGATVLAALEQLEATMFVLAEAFRAGQRVELRGLGTFTPRITKERQGRNPKTGAPAIIKPRLAVKFRLSPTPEHVHPQV